MTPSTRRRPSAPSTRSRGVRVDVVVDGHGLDEARLPREDDEVEDGAGEVEPPADEPVDDRGLDLVRAVLSRLLRRNDLPTTGTLLCFALMYAVAGGANLNNLNPIDATAS